jgi:hypothetical protein
VSSHDNIVADIVANLAVECPIPADFLPTDAIVLIGALEGDGDEGLFEAHSFGLSWLMRVGMMNAALTDMNVDDDWSGD